MRRLVFLAKRAVNGILRPLDLRLERVEAKRPRTQVHRLDLAPVQMDGMDADTRRVLNLLNYTKSSGSPYSADGFQAGYHSTTVGGRRFIGQRSPSERLSGVPFDFKGKTVLDIGCNQGGMLFELSEKIEAGVGIDFDSRMINAANRLRAHNGNSNIDFYVFDLEREDLGYIEDFLASSRVDIVFLLSICMWIKNWREVVDFASSISDHILFESNGSLAQLEEQEDHLVACFRDVRRLAEFSNDDPNQKQRKLYLCSAALHQARWTSPGQPSRA